MIDFDFNKGAIWEIFYFAKTSDLNADAENTLVDNQTRNILQDTFDPPPNLASSDYSYLFVEHFIKTREKSREVVKKNFANKTRTRVLSQVGNVECLKELDEIEKLSIFDSWENQSIVDFFKQVSKQYLNE